MIALLQAIRPFVSRALVLSVAINLLQLAPVIFMIQVFDRVIISGSKETLAVLILLTALAQLFWLGLDIVRSRILLSASSYLDRFIGPQLFEYASTPTTVRAMRANGDFRDLTALRLFVSGPALLALMDIPWVALYCLVLFIFHWSLGLTGFVSACVLIAVATWNELSTRTGLELVENEGRHSSSLLDEATRNQEAISALGLIDGVKQRWVTSTHRTQNALRRASIAASTFASTTKQVRQFIQTLILAQGVYLVIGEHASPGIMIAATVVLGKALAPIDSIVATWKITVDARSAASKLRESLTDQGEECGGIELSPPQGHIRCESLYFRMPASDHALINGISIGIPAGQSVMIIGPSGAGKSTLAKLLVGAWSPMHGCVRLDGTDVALWRPSMRAEHFGYLPQDIQLFSATVHENIGRFSSADSEMVFAAAKMAGVHNTILHLPRGYETVIGNNGHLLSGGERQKIGLARALFGNPRIVVLDEPSAFLDRTGERDLMDCIRALKSKGTTVIFVSHRLDFASQFDRVVALRNGSISKDCTGLEFDSTLMRIAQGNQHSQQFCVP